MQTATTSIQHQNLKTFLTAFIGMLVAVPIVAMVTVAVVKAELGSAAFAAQNVAPTTSQTNSMPVGPSCVVPAGAQAAAGTGSSVAGPVAKGWGYGKVSNSFNQTNTSTTTTTSTSYADSFNATFVIASNNNNGSQNGNTVGSNNGNGNAVASNNGNNNTTASNNNTAVDSGNTTTVVTNNDNDTAVNSGNTINNDNDVIDIL